MARPKTFDDDILLDAALQLFWERGYDGTSIGELEARLGVGRQSLYNAFGDKRALFHRALARYAAAGRARREAALAPEGGLAGIRAYFLELAAFLGEGAAGRGCFLANCVVREAAEDDAVAAQCRGNETALQRELRGALAVARERGEVPHDLPLDVAARALVSHSYGLSSLARGGATRAELEATARWVVDRLA